MATFYVLPPRECLERAVAEFVGRVIPGVPVSRPAWDDWFAVLAPTGDDVVFVHREDLPGVGPVADELAAGFGAEAGDAVVEVRSAPARRSAVSEPVAAP